MSVHGQIFGILCFKVASMIHLVKVLLTQESLTYGVSVPMLSSSLVEGGKGCKLHVDGQCLVSPSQIAGCHSISEIILPGA